jgi:hypothetical protein
LKTNAKVVLKYQYPEVETLFKEDLKTVAFFCKMLQPEMSPMMEEMERQFLTEFDFAREGWGNCCACVVCAFFSQKFCIVSAGRNWRGGAKEIRRKERAHSASVPQSVLSTRLRHGAFGRRKGAFQCCRQVLFLIQCGLKLVDGFRRVYGQMAKDQGMTLEEMQSKREKEGKAQVSGLQLTAYRAMLSLRNFAANAYNYSLGWVLPNIPISTLPPNHVRFFCLCLFSFSFFEQR